MGWFGSSEEVEVEANGQVNNNVIIKQGETIDENSNEICYLLLIICIIKIIELILYIYKKWQNNMKKKYVNATTATNGNKGQGMA